MSFSGSKAATYELPIIQQGDNMLIDARLLHKKLKSGRQYTDWIKFRIKEYNFVENQDFFISQKNEAVFRGGGHNRIDFLLTMDMAKELAMLERNEIGRAIRRYFIQKEKEARGISNLPRVAELFKGLKPKRINDREMYPYREVLERAGYSKNTNGNRRHRYWMHFVKEGNILYVTKEFSLHLYHQKRVFNNRATMLASTPVLPFDFGSPLQLQGGAL